MTPLNINPSHIFTDSLNGSAERAVVLGGGGSAGNAWLIGVIAGLFDAGLDLPSADLIVGTSAGSTAAVQLAGASSSQLLASILTEQSARQIASPSSNAGKVLQRQFPNQMERLNQIISESKDPEDMCRRIGRVALEKDRESVGSDQSRWRSIVAARLTLQDWPDRKLFITAVDADTGHPVVFDRYSGIDLVDAVAASCSNGFSVPPYELGRRRYLDGGYRRNENADLATGYPRVLVLSPFGGRTLTPLAWGRQLEAQVEELRARGSIVEIILPDQESLDAFGHNMLDLARRPPSARAGYEQGRALAVDLVDFWG